MKYLMAVALSFSTFIACGSDRTTSAPTRTPPPPPPHTLTIESLSVRQAGDNETVCRANPWNKVDDVLMTVANPSKISLENAQIRREGNPGPLATVSHCEFTTCRAALESPPAAFPNVGDQACILTEEATGRTTIRFYARNIFRPSDTYRLVLAAGGVVSNVAEGTVVRLPNAANENPAILSVVTRGVLSGGKPYADAEIDFYNPASSDLPFADDRDGIEIEASYLNARGELDEMTRVIIVHTLFAVDSLSDHVQMSTAPPWTLRLVARRTRDATRSPLQRCGTGSDIARCPLPPSTGTVVWESSQQSTIDSITP